MAKWIWHYGDFEIYHNLLLHSRREEFRADFPPFWNLDKPHPLVRFEKEFDAERDGEMTAYINGKGCLFLDGRPFPEGVTAEVKAGHHKAIIRAMNVEGLPAAYVESDVCPSDESWRATHMTEKVFPVGATPEYSDRSVTPETFIFHEELIKPVFSSKEGDGFLWDFGKETFARLIVRSTDLGEINVYYGETTYEALSEEGALISDTVSGKREYELPARAFRYIYVKGDSAKDVSLEAIYEYLPLEDRGSFECDNELLNKIWDISSYTFHLNSREFFLDGIKRDRWVWSGDAYQSYMVNNYLYFDKEITRRTILALRGQDHVEQHINTILDYSFYWIISIYDFYMTYDDVEFLRYIFPKMKYTMSFVETRLNDKGFIIGRESDWVFVDWANFDKKGALFAEQILFWKSYKTMAEVAKLLDEPYEEYLTLADNLYKSINEYFWNDEKGAFIDGYESGVNHVTRHGNIFALHFDFATPYQKERIITSVIRNPEVAAIATPYFKFYELMSLAETGDLDSVTSEIIRYWGGMVSLGATTFWEKYDPQIDKSLEGKKFGPSKFFVSRCHAWGAGPIYLFGRYYLGVYPTSPGYKTFNVEPNLSTLGFVKGSVPINDGVVSVNLNEEFLSVTSEVEGGTLIWKGERYPLIPNETIKIKI